MRSQTFTIRKAVEEDLGDLLKIFDTARKFMRANNNPGQWSDNYPGKEIILSDIRNGNCYMGQNDEGETVFAFAFIVGNDPTYEVITEGNWLNDRPYGTIHRIASNGKTGGALKAAVDYCFQRTDNIRIDTHKDNAIMLKGLEKLGFIKCGIIRCRDGSPRIAFQKCLIDRKEI